LGITFCLSLSTLFIVLFPSINNSRLIDEDKIKNNFRSIIEVKAFDEIDRPTYGTGFFVSKKEIITNKHVVYLQQSDGSQTQYKSIYIRFADEEEYTEVILQKTSETLDLALLSIDVPINREPLKIDESEIFYGDQIYTLSNSLNFGLSYTQGTISQPKVNLEINNVISEFLQLELSTAEGSSGAPVLNNKGKVIGIITLRQRDPSGIVVYGYVFAITSKKLKEFLNSI
jgi:S1-C subfamily serine protease